jgi:hypothetical protein
MIHTRSTDYDQKDLPTFGELRARQRAEQDVQTKAWLRAVLARRTPTRAAAIAQVDRTHLYRLAKAHGLQIRHGQVRVPRKPPGRNAWLKELTPQQRAAYDTFIKSGQYRSAEARALLGV